MGPVPSGRPGARLAARRQGPLRSDRLHHAGRARAGGHRGARARSQAGRDRVRGQLSRLRAPGRHQGAEADRAVGAGDRQRARQGHPADRRPHRHGQDRQARARHAARCPLRNGLRQARRRALVRYLHHRGLAGYVDLLPVGPRPYLRGTHPGRRAQGVRTQGTPER